jgi:tRNA A-37 threonylcarbamoyl transferase component Bud32/rRNA maturation protein Nop10
VKAVSGRDRLRRLVDRIGRNPAETEDERVRRAIWVMTLAIATPLCLVLAAASLLFDHRPAAVLMLLFCLFIAAQLALFSILGRGLEQFALASQLACVGFSFAGVVALGGPARSGGLVFLGIIGPLYALAFPSRRRAVVVFGLYLASLAGGALLTGWAPWARPLAPAVNVASFAVMSAIVSSFVFAALFFFVRERDRAVQGLRRAEEQISRLLASTSGASENLAGWSRAIARDIAGTVGARRIGIWEVRDREVVELADEGLPAPSMDDLERAVGSEERQGVEGSGGTIVPVTGASGDLRGALVVERDGAAWSQTERNLISGFAHQLGSALDMKILHARLAVTDTRRALSRREMHEQGIATLQVCPRCGRCYDHRGDTCEDDGTRLDAPYPLPFRLLDRYSLSRVLGIGGMGMVLAARDERLDREVAIKVIRPEHFNNTDLRVRFEREARTIARVQHPGVISVHDSGELDDGTAYLVMERLAGCDLSRQIRACGRGTPAQVAALVRQGSAALGAAHRAGVIHRDVKPENVFLVGQGDGFRVKVLDFGLARPLASEAGLTHTGMMVGTPAYMSPEQVSGEVLDARTDVYSFAAVCYEALTGVRVAAKGDLGRVMISVLNDVPPPPSAVVPGLPPEVDAAFASALAKDRARRLKSIELWSASFVDGLDRVEPGPGLRGWSLAPVAAGPGAGPEATLSGPAGLTPPAPGKARSRPATRS